MWWCGFVLILVGISWPKLVVSSTSWKWRDLTDSEMSEWYSPADLCVLNTSMRSSFPQDIRAKECSQYTRGSRRMFCGVGMGNNNYPCYGPYGEGRPSFRRGVEGYTNASSKPLLDLVNRLLDSHTTLLLLGDSTTRQKLQAFQCELARTDPRIRFNGNLFGIVPCDTLLRVYMPDKREFHVYGVSLGPRATECIGKHFPTKLSGEELKAIIAEDPTLGIGYHANKLLDMINHEQNRSVLVIANTGLWYNIESEYREVMPGVLAWLHNRTQLRHNQYGIPLQNHVAWHETLRQHWISTDGTGYFHVTVVDAQEAAWKQVPLDNDTLVPAKEFMVPHCCQHISNSSDWRNDIARQLIQAKPQYVAHIPILPMADITRDIPDLHTCNPYYKHDCTHYCFTPLMYQPLWHQMRELAMSFQPVSSV